MNGRKLSTALNTLPEDMVAEAMEPGHRGRGFSWLRLAVCAVFVLGLFVGFWPTQPEIVTAPGLLTVTVYAEDSSSQTAIRSERLKLGVRTVLGTGWSPAMSRYPGLPIMLSVNSEDFPSDKITFDICVSEGKYEEWGSHTDYRIVSLPTRFTKNNYTTIYWSVDFDDDLYTQSYDNVYTYIVLKCEEYIIGYAVVRFDRRYDEYGATLTYDPFFVASVLFPKVEGRYQVVSYEYVEMKLRERK